MIQRIQSLYLLIVTVLQVILLFSSIITATTESEGLISIKTLDYTSIAIITAISILLAFVTIFLYRKRIVQIRITIYNIILLLALQGFFVYYMITVGNNPATISTSYFS